MKNRITATWMRAKMPSPDMYPSTISARVAGVAARRSIVPWERSRKKATQASRKTKNIASTAMYTGAM